MIDKIIFLVSSLSQPRAIRRVETIAAMGYYVKVYGYDRGQYNCNKISQGIDVTVLGTMSKGGGYASKVKQIKRDVQRIVKEEGTDNCLYYSFGYIETFFLHKHKVRYAYEISDIAYSTGVMGRLRPILKQIDRKLVRDSAFTLMTSEGFKKYLNVKDANVIIQPNKVNRKLLGCQRTVLQKKENKFVFSFVGSIRYEPIMRFARVIGAYFPQHEFHFYGVANINYTKRVLEELTTRYPNVKMFGAFKNPDDFMDIYGKVDIVVTTYGHTFNELILDPNKLYEGILFCRPLVATEKTFLAEQVQKYKCGWNIDSSTDEGIRKFVECLAAESVNAVSLSEKALPDDFAFDNNDNLGKLLATL